MSAITLYLGLDVHKDSITIAQSGRNGEVRLFGTIANSMHALKAMLGRVRKAHPGAHLEAAYEAGPCGFGIQPFPKKTPFCLLTFRQPYQRSRSGTARPERPEWNGDLIAQLQNVPACFDGQFLGPAHVNASV
jgi:hypothetical protein